MIFPEPTFSAQTKREWIPDTQLELFDPSEHYAWEWPRLSFLKRQMLFPDEVIRNSGWAASVSSSRRKNFVRIYQAAFGQVARAISRPSPVFQGRTTRLEFLDCLAWVIDPHRRSVALELKAPGGSWAASDWTFDMHDPLDNLNWLDQFMLRWHPVIERMFGSRAEEASWGIHSLLVEQFHVPALLAATSRQVRHHVGARPELVTVMGYIGRWDLDMPCDNEVYSQFWKEEASWINISGHYRGLAHLYYLARSRYLLDNNANLGGLRAKCFELGLSRAGWRFLCRHGELAYMALLDDDDEALPLGVLLAYVDWQARAELHKPFHFDYGRCLLETGCVAMNSSRKYRVNIDPRFAKAGEHLSELEAAKGADWWAWERLQDWRSVIRWVRDEQPLFDRNQWQAGWPVIYQRFLKWLRSKQPEVSWQPVLGSFCFQDWKIRELASSAELEAESSRMHHCAETYVDLCHDKAYLMFTVESARAGEPIATIGFEEDAGGWSLDQVQGKCNGDPGPAMETVATQIRQRLKELFEPAGG